MIPTRDVLKIDFFSDVIYSEVDSKSSTSHAVVDNKMKVYGKTKKYVCMLSSSDKIFNVFKLDCLHTTDFLLFNRGTGRMKLKTTKKTCDGKLPQFHDEADAE